MYELDVRILCSYNVYVYDIELDVRIQEGLWPFGALALHSPTKSKT